MGLFGSWYCPDPLPHGHPGRLGCGDHLLVALLIRADPEERPGNIIAGETELGLASVAFVFPWLMTLYLQWGIGYPPEFKVLKSTFFSLSRLGGSVHYPTNLPVLALILLAVLLGLRKPNRAVTVLLLWGILSCLVAFSKQTSYFLDPVTTLISLCVPVALNHRLDGRRTRPGTQPVLQARRSSFGPGYCGSRRIRNQGYSRPCQLHSNARRISRLWIGSEQHP